MSEDSVKLLDHLHGATDRLVLDYDARLVRRKRLVTERGRAVMLDLSRLTDLGRHAGLRLADGTEVALVAAEEPVLVIRGDLPRLAWHVGNRHAPCQIGADHLVIRADPVLRDMLVQLGAEVTDDARPFEPEGGAYGHGRTMGHSHDHPHDPDH